MQYRNKTKKLLENVFIYMVGTVISKVLNIIFIPFITIYLTTAEYGYYDIILTTITLLAPIFTLQSIDAVFRLLFEADDNKKKRILTNVWLIIGAGNVFFTILSLGFHFFVHNLGNIYLIILYYIINVLINMYQRIARSYSLNLAFSISGIIQAVLMVLLELYFLIFLHMKIDGLLLAYILSGIISIIYLELKVHAINGLNLSYIKKNVLYEIVKLSLPLIPNNICWWATASINKFIILFYIGESANGLYALTIRFASIITMVTSVFALAWQETTIIDYNNEDKEKFNSSIFEKYFISLILSSLIIILFLKLCYSHIIASEYYESWIYIPVTMLGTIFTAISTFYGTGYLAAKKTKGAFYSTIISAITNILICWALITFIGVMAAPIASLIAYLILWIIRHFTMKSYYRIILNMKSIIFLLVIFAIGSFIYYYCDFIINLIALLVVLVVSLIFAFTLFKDNQFCIKIRKGNI